MLMTDLIAKKRDGFELSTEEIDWMICSYVDGEVADYQMSAMCMAIFLLMMLEAMSGMESIVAVTSRRA